MHIHYARDERRPGSAAALRRAFDRIWRRSWRWIIGLLRPDHVSLAGPIVNLGEPFLNQVIEKTEAMLWPKVIHPVTFSLAYSGNLSAIGAAALALHRELDIL